MSIIDRQKALSLAREIRLKVLIARLEAEGGALSDFLSSPKSMQAIEEYLNEKLNDRAEPKTAGAAEEEQLVEWLIGRDIDAPVSEKENNVAPELWRQFLITRPLRLQND